jgi:endonuclease-3
MDKKDLAIKILSILEKKYPNPRTKLVWKTPWELLVATILAAQCTDDRVNKVTPVFFERWPDIKSLAHASQKEVEQVIHSTGFYKNKAKNLINASKKILTDYNGQVPSTMEELLSLPGVARKTANIVLSNCFSKNEGIAVDTHVKRISFRLGLTSSKNPAVIEKDLMELFPQQKWHLVNHLLVWFGRDICKARTPQCHRCELDSLCPKNGI